MEERNRKIFKDFYKVIKCKTELFQCYCLSVSVLVHKWTIPMDVEKKKVPLGSLSHQKPWPKIQFLP